MPKVPKKNISSQLADVKWPKSGKPEKDLIPMPLPPEKDPPIWTAGWITLACAAVAILLGILYFAGPSGASQTYSQANVISDAKNFLQGALQKYQSFQTVSVNSLNLVSEVGNLESLVPGALKGQNGEALIASLNNINNYTKAIADNSGEASYFGKMFFGDDNPVSLGAKLQGTSDFLTAFIPWLQGEHRLLVLFQNPSELRPAGGFLGSFAVVSLKNGAVTDFKVYDVNEADKVLSLKTVPPQPIQAFSSGWYLRDSNWFFNFPDSAAEAEKFAEASDLFKKDNIKFDGVVAVSDEAMKDMLTVSGPVRLQDGTTLTSGNFLKELQRAVEESRRANSQEPKQVLKELAPGIIQNLSSLSAVQKNDLVGLGENWFKNKDVVLTLKDEKLNSFIHSAGWDGEVVNLPADFEGDYLAVVSANMASGKSDIVIVRNIDFKTQIYADGTADNKLTVTRNHQGNLEQDSWYKTVNESYFQIFTLPSANLKDFTGGTLKKIKARDYSGFSQDALVNSIQATSKSILGFPGISTYAESGKNVFAFWSRLAPGEKKTLEVDYSTRLHSAIQDGSKYEFVFEKQSGTEGEYHFTFMSPPGFEWQENNSPIYEYTTSDPPGRLILHLNLIKVI